MRHFIVIDEIKQEQFDAGMQQAMALLASNITNEVVVASKYAERQYCIDTTKLCTMTKNDSILNRTYNTAALDKHGIVY